MVSDFFVSSGTLTSVSSNAQLEAEGQEFLRFHLVPDTTAVLPIAQISEVITISYDSIVPIPHMQPWVMGVYNWRGEILWIADLGHIIGLSPWYEQGKSVASYSAIVLHEGTGSSKKRETDRKMLGLVVDRVEDIELFNPDLLQSPPASAVTPELVPFLQGYWVKENGDMLLSLDGQAILKSVQR